MKLNLPALKGRDLFAYLVKNKEDLIEAKKSTAKFADATLFLPAPIDKVDADVVKASGYLYENGEESLKRTIVANTYNWLDSHDDVHLEGVFSDSISKKAASGRIQPHLYDHNFSMLSKVGRPISYSERTISWRALGIGKTGTTQALILESEVLRSYNERIFNEYKDDQVDQHSVAMRYIKLALAVNDEDNYPNEYKVWKDVINKLGNRAEAEKRGYFWAVSEAALIETSAVLAGSNELTPTLGKSESIKSEEPKRVRLDSAKVLSYW